MLLSNGTRGFGSLRVIAVIIAPSSARSVPNGKMATAQAPKKMRARGQYPPPTDPLAARAHSVGLRSHAAKPLTQRNSRAALARALLD